ncbi:MAG TPA: universal stress protein [Clostridia bacterium]|nr:universal stress protein [Clostridia bacterium]
MNWRIRRTPPSQARNNRGEQKKGLRRAAGTELSWSRILVPIDFSRESTRALKVAMQLGQAGGELILVHVVGPVYEVRDFGYGPVQRRRPNESLMRRAKPRLKALARRHVSPKWEWRCLVLSGTAPRQILKAAAEVRAELVVMPTRGLSHAPPTELGSTAERVVRHAPCPVLVLPKRMTKTRRK